MLKAAEAVPKRIQPRSKRQPQSMIDRPIYHLTWDGPIVPKARPRFSRGGGGVTTHMPPEYEAMKAEAIESFSDQWLWLGHTSPIPWKVRPYVFFWGKHHQGGDFADNVPGTLYDALVQAGVLKDDNGTWCPGAVPDLVHSKAPPQTDVLLAPWIPFAQSEAQGKEIREWLRINS